MLCNVLCPQTEASLNCKTQFRLSAPCVVLRQHIDICKPEDTPVMHALCFWEWPEDCSDSERFVLLTYNSVCFLLQEHQQEDSRYPHPRRPLKTAVQPTVSAAHKAPPVPATAQPNPKGGNASPRSHIRRGEVPKELFVVICLEQLGLDALAKSREVFLLLGISVVLQPPAAC